MHTTERIWVSRESLTSKELEDCGENKGHGETRRRPQKHSQRRTSAQCPVHVEDQEILEKKIAEMHKTEQISLLSQ